MDPNANVAEQINILANPWSEIDQDRLEGLRDELCNWLRMGGFGPSVPMPSTDEIIRWCEGRHHA